MDKDVLMNTLNRLEGKVDNLSTGLTKNTSVTESHSQMLHDMKSVHDVNAKLIIDTLDQVKDLKGEVLKINSWKDAQTNFQQQTLKDVKSIYERLSPVEKDYIDRVMIKDANNKSFREIKWRAIERVGLVILGAILLSWRTIIDTIFK